MPKQLPALLAAPIALAALAAALSGCGGSSTSTTASSTSAAATTSAAAPAGPEAGSLAAVCPDIDTVMGANPDSDPAATAAKLDEIRAKVTTPDGDLIAALADAYAAIAANPNVAAGTPGGEELVSTLSSSAQDLGAACQAATTAPVPN